MLLSLVRFCLVLAVTTEGVLAGLIKAGYTNTLTSTTTSTIVCSTKKASTGGKSPLPTTTTTKRLLPEIIFRVTTSVPTSTITPGAVTTTKTVTATSTVIRTLPQNTTGITTTLVSISSTTTTPTSVVTETDTATTTTTTTTTSVVPTPSGFLPIEQTLNINKKKRDLDHPHNGLVRRTNQPQCSRQSTLSWKPVSVQCVDYERVKYTVQIILIKSATTVTAPAPTSTATATVTKTTTSTVVPPNVTLVATVTSITSTTLTANPFVTMVTTSTTSTVTESSSTVSYAACATDNVLPPSAGYEWSSDTADDLVAVDAFSGYDCCVSCMTSGNCVNAILDGTSCTLFTYSRAPLCSYPNNAGTASGGNPPLEGLSNGPCHGWYPA